MITYIKPRKALNASYSKLPVLAEKIEILRANLKTYIELGKPDESEEYHKGLIKDFLANTWYGNDYSLNTNYREDLVIYNGKDVSANAGVIIEAKSPVNKSEMFSEKNENCKALQECVYYFMQESITKKNSDIKKIIITNYEEWFIFEAKDFFRFFCNKANSIYDEFIKFELGQLTDTKTSYFYEKCAKPAIDKWLEKENINIVHFSIRDFYDAESNKLSTLYKILSPENLLSKPFANDSNSLDKNFYAELLHIIGLEEVKESGKKLIKRKEKENRNKASLLEQAIYQLEDEISNEEKCFETALRLVITWVNRLLFLKLVESQQLSYQNKNPDYSFLTIKKVQDFDELNDLFFKVLGKRVENRDEELQKKFSHVPYLNSSLFEPTEDEGILKIRGIKNRPLELFSQTVLKNDSGKKLTGEMDNLQYFFEFLDSYNFASDSSDEIQNESKTLINASVLGLIFEKINGYKDGSFFTPGFITQYMVEEAIDKAVVQKFNEVKGWKCNNLDEVEDNIGDTNEDRIEANRILNSVKICDPAVGSGHFLVSALNRLLFIKSYLNILFDKNGKRIKRGDWELKLENDEITVVNDEGNRFEYKVSQKNNSEHNNDIQRVQEALFNEKRTIIENCLFGVDINPNSVYICRLRLWIELLKNTYYTEQSNFTQLETLPNIDINIKCGNSLISKFPVKVGESVLSRKTDDVQNKELKKLIPQYKKAVAEYKRESNKDSKRKVTELIASIKGRLTESKQLDLFDEEYNKELLAGGIFKNSMEWMIEFPEVLSDDGIFEGFDCVIGNPPYGLFNKKQNQKVALSSGENEIDLIKNRFPEADEGMINAAKVFYALGFRLCAQKGFVCMIIPFGILADTSSVKIRKSIFENHTFLQIEAFPERDSTSRRVFEDAKMSTCIILSANEKICSDLNVGVTFEKRIPKVRSEFSVDDIKNFNSEKMQIPMCERKTFDLLMKLKNDSRLKHFGEVAPCLTGELDMTQGKKFLTSDSSKTMLVKGVQISRYIFKTKDEEISQGKIEFVNKEDFFKICSEQKQEQTKHERIILQGLSGINEKYRLKATIIPEDLILANSSNFLKYQSDYSLNYLLGLFNSSLLNFIFKATSTSSNVNGYEVDSLPIPAATKNQQNEIIALVNKILEAKKSGTDTTELEKQIDQKVYDLYGLTEEEIKVVEGK